MSTYFPHRLFDHEGAEIAPPTGYRFPHVLHGHRIEQYVGDRHIVPLGCWIRYHITARGLELLAAEDLALLRLRYPEAAE